MLILAALLFLCNSSALALDPSLDISQYAHTAWKIRDGFTKGQITSIAQTPDGYLWLGTEFGLFRFDGVRNAPWQPPQGQQLPSNVIYRLFAARDGTLWIGTEKGLASWKDGKLRQYPETANHFIFAVVEDHEGTIWASVMSVTFGKLCAIQKGKVECFGGDGILGRGTFNLYVDSKGNLWVGVLDGLWRWRPGLPKFYPLPGEANGIEGLGEDVEGSLLVGWKGGIHRLVDGKVEPYLLPGPARQFQSRRIFRDRNGGLWIGTHTQGLVHVHEGRTDVFAPSDGLSGENVYSLFEDREGSVWVATNTGLDRFRDFAVSTFSVSQGLSTANVGSVLADRDGSVFIATYGGLNRWKDGQITVPPTGSGKRDGKLNGLAPSSLFQDDRGRIWVSTNREFGYLESGRFFSISGLPGGQVLGIAQVSEGSLWIANEQFGLFQLRPDGKVQHIPWGTLGQKDHASVLAADPLRGGLWVGFFLGGVSYFNNSQIRESYGAPDGLGGGRVSDIRFDREGTVWIAAESGLSRLKNNRIGTLTSKNGLPCDTVHWVMEDGDHSFWLYMSCGLVRIPRTDIDAWAAAVDQNKDTKRTVQATVFDNSDGVRSLASPGYYTPQVGKSADGKMWFNPWDGVSVVDPRHLPFNKLPPPVHIEQITADRKTYDAASYKNGDMPLPALVRDLEIDYTALSLVAPEKIRFRYKLEGRDSDWREAGNRRQAFYTDLPPRNYRFRVMACNNSGVWNETGAFLDFSVAPAYYQTKWFRVSCVAAFLLALLALYQLRLRELRREFKMRLEERIGERTRIARDLHDTLLQSFQGLMFRFQAARNQLPERPEEASEALDSALVSGDRALEEGRDSIQQLRSELLKESNMEQMLLGMGRELASSQNGEHSSPPLRVIIEGTRRAKRAMIREEIYRIARELLRNAYRHAHARSIEVELRYDDDAFVLIVRDDGKGIDPEVLKEHGRAGHWGLRGLYERAEGIGARLDVWSEAGAGTEVKLTVPAKLAYETARDGSRFRLFRKAGKHEQRS